MANLLKVMEIKITNEEKAKELFQSYFYTDKDANSICLGALKMAEWKDQQFKEYLEKQKAELIEKAWKVFEKYATYMHPRKDEEVCKMTKYQFLKAMEEEK